MKKAYYQTQAINATINEFGLKNQSSTQIALGGSSGDPNYRADTDYDPSTGKIKTTIYDEAFTSTPGDLAVTIDHEFCHGNQATGSSCLTNLQTIGKRWYMDPEGYDLNEVEARQLLLQDFDKYGYGLTYGVTVDRIYAYKIDINTAVSDFPDIQKCLDTDQYIEPCQQE